MVISSCAKVETYDKPHMLEGFTGAVKVTPGIEGITANTYTPGFVFFNSNKTGSEIVMYGPTTSNFSLYSIFPDDSDDKKKFATAMEDMGISPFDKLDFSGFRGSVDPTDGKRVTFYDFGDQSEGMKKFGWKVQGSGLIDGVDTKVVIKISTTVGVLQKMLPDLLLQKLGVPDTDVSLKDWEDPETVVYLARIDVLGEAVTLAY